MGQSGNPDEKDLDRYLKAHDDLQTVLRVYEGVVDGSEALPLSRGGGGGGGGTRGTGEATAAAEAAFAAAAVAAAKSNGAGNAVENGGAAKNGTAAAAAAATTASGGRSSPARGNLLDLEENTPLETSMTGEGAGGMLVAYTDGQFMASTSNSVGGVSGLGGVGFDSFSGAAQGSATASNYASASDTGAVYGSNQFGSNHNSSSNNLGSTNFGSGGGGGDGSSGFGERAILPDDVNCSWRMGFDERFYGAVIEEKVVLGWQLGLLACVELRLGNAGSLAFLSFSILSFSHPKCIVIWRKLVREGMRS